MLWRYRVAENKFRYTLTRKDLADIKLVARLPEKVSIGLRVGVFLSA